MYVWNHIYSLFPQNQLFLRQIFKGIEEFSIDEIENLSFEMTCTEANIKKRHKDWLN